MFGDSEYAIQGNATIVLRITAPTPEAALDTWHNYQAVTIDHTHVRDGRATLLTELSTDPTQAHVVEINGNPQPDHIPSRVTLDHATSDSLAASIAALDPATEGATALDENFEPRTPLEPGQHEYALQGPATVILRINATSPDHARRLWNEYVDEPDGDTHDDNVTLTKVWTEPAPEALDPLIVFEIDGVPQPDDHTRTHVVLDLANSDTAITAVARLTQDQRNQLRDALTWHAQAATCTALLDTIRTVLATDCPDHTAIGVLFTTDEHNNGYYLDSGDATVLFDDDTTTRLDFGSDAEDHLADLYGSHGPRFAVTVTLPSGDLHDHDDYDPADDIRTYFPTPKSNPAT